ncbi:MAG: flagellar basal body P-ring formation chaperone FlgA [Syntrophobacteraceae bacterium]
MRNRRAMGSLIFFLLALTAAPDFLGTPARASTNAPLTEIRILPEVMVRQKDVFLADICAPETVTKEWKAIAGEIQIGDAPPAGSEKFIEPSQLRSYLVKLLESKGLSASDVNLDIPERITIRREAVQITREMVENIFREHVMRNSPWKDNEVSIQRVQFTGLPVIPAGPMTYQVVQASAKERFIGNVNASIEFFVNGEKARTLGVTGRVEVFGNVYLASRPLRQNDVITAADLEINKINLTDSADRFATRPEQVDNRRIVRNIGVHQPIELKDLDKPLVMKRGDPVIIVYDQPGLQVTAKGQSNADGSVGDTLTVINVASKKTIHCKVVDAQTVRAVR